MVGIAVGGDLRVPGPAARRVIQGNRKRDSPLEIAMRRLSQARGFRCRLAGRPLPARPSMANLVFCGSRCSLHVPADMGSRSAARSREPTMGTGAAGSSESCVGHSNGHGASGGWMDRTSHPGARAAGWGAGEDRRRSRYFRTGRELG